MLKQRIVTAVALLLFFLGALYFLPAIPWMLLTLLAVLVGAWEWAGIARYSANGRWLYLLMTLLLCLGLLALGDAARNAAFAASTLFWLVPAGAWLAFQWRLKHTVAMAGMGWLLLLPTWLALVYLRQINPNLLLTLMMVVWIADSAAYFTGRRFGKHKLAPAISPGKTWEGVGGALAGVTAFSMAVVLWVGASWGIVPAFWGLAALSIIGDLFESWMKRVAGIKDSGTILPGHGGVLDRIDGLIPTLPAASLCIAWMNWGVLVK